MKNKVTDLTVASKIKVSLHWCSFKNLATWEYGSSDVCTKWKKSLSPFN